MKRKKRTLYHKDQESLNKFDGVKCTDCFDKGIISKCYGGAENEKFFCTCELGQQQFNKHLDSLK